MGDGLSPDPVTGVAVPIWWRWTPDQTICLSRLDDCPVAMGRTVSPDPGHDPLTLITRMDRHWGTPQPPLTRRVARVWW